MPRGRLCSSTRHYRGLPELEYPFHYRTLHVTRKKINLSTVFAGHAVGIKDVEEGIWLVSFMDYDFGYIDLEEKLCSLSTTLLAPKRYLCSRYVLQTYVSGPDP
jgi:hypothetical protein